MECRFVNYFNRFSIAKKFFIISVIILLFILLIFNIIIFNNFKNVFIKRDKKLFTQWIESTLKEHLRFFVFKNEWNENIDFTPLVNEIKKFPDIINVTFYSSNGKILYSLRNDIKKNVCYFKEALNSAIKGNFIGEFYNINNRVIQIFFYPFIFKGKVRGIIQICKNPENLLREINKFRIIVLSMSFGGFLGYIILVYLIITRIEEREKRLQEEIEKYQRLSCLGHFSAKMSHELGTPLHVIQGNVELIGDVADDEFVKERIYIVNRQIHKINNIIKNYLFLAKEPVPEYNYFSLKEFILTLLDQFNFIVPDNIKIKTDLVDCSLFSDKDFIEQILYNFIKNSIDSIGEREGFIILKTYIKDKFVYIEVIDNGKGFPPEIKDKLFDPFFTTKKTGKGTGLGLSVCKDLIESLGGEIYCNSEMGLTTFGIKIPVEQNIYA